MLAAALAVAMPLALAERAHAQFYCTPPDGAWVTAAVRAAGLLRRFHVDHLVSQLRADPQDCVKGGKA